MNVVRILRADLLAVDLGWGTLVNGDNITEQVHVESAASTQSGKFTSVTCVKADQPFARDFGRACLLSLSSVLKATAEHFCVLPDSVELVLRYPAVEQSPPLQGVQIGALKRTL